MTGGIDDDEARDCIGCHQTVPPGRSVCPTCGLLQPSKASTSSPPPQPAPRTAPRTVAQGSANPVPAPASVPAVQSVMAVRNPSPKKMAVSVIVLAVLVASVIAVALHVTGDDNASNPANAKTGHTLVRSTDPRASAIRSFCANPHALTKPANIGTFTPGQGAVAYVEVPEPASAVVTAGYRVVQVSPQVGKPNLSLDKSIGFVSVAVCVQQSATRKVGATCDYRLAETNQKGERRTAQLLETEYRGRIYDLRSGKALATGKLTTPTDVCPSSTYLGGAGVSNPLTADMVLAWIGFQLPGGKPA